MAAKRSPAVKLARIDPQETPASAGVMIAQEAFRNARRGKPTEADRPPPSLFPMTPAARAAVTLDREHRKRNGP